MRLDRHEIRSTSHPLYHAAECCILGDVKRFALFVSMLALTACSHSGKTNAHAGDLEALHIVGTGIHPTESTTSIDARAQAWCAARMAGKNSLQANSSAYPGWGSELTLAQVSAFSASARAAFCPTVSP